MSEKFDIKSTDSIMIGDRLSTDIAFGNDAGMDTLFVLSGVNTLDDMNESSVKPTYYTNSVADLLL